MRLPSKEEFEKLCKCYSRFDNELKGRLFYDEETGEKLFFPCEGYLFDTTSYHVGKYGSYWSSTCNIDSGACGFYFTSNCAYPNLDLYRHYSRSVRLVSDEQFEGSVHVAGLYWNQTNEIGYYTYDEAMKKFNK